MDDGPWLVVGLGNPGATYEGNRHNVGQMVLAELADRRKTSFKRHKQHALVAEGRSFGAGPRLVLGKPLSFMNESGGPVAKLLRFYSVEPDHLIVVHDELDIPFGALKLKQGGGHGGHNGVRDIAKAVGTPDFFRVRVGVGRPPGRQDPADFVLSDFKKPERVELPSVLAEAADAVETIAASGLERAQQQFNAARA